MWRSVFVVAFLVTSALVATSTAVTAGTPAPMVPPPLRCVDSMAAPIVPATPSVEVSAAPNPGDAGVPIDFCSEVTGLTGAYTLNWSFDDGTYSNAADPVHTYLNAMDYTVTLTLNSTDYNTTKIIFEYVNPALESTESFTPMSPTTATPVTFNVTPSQGTAPYVAFWNFGDGTTATGLGVLHTYHAAGSYTVEVWTNDSGGGSIYQEFQVVVAGVSGGGGSTPLGGVGILVGTTVAAVAVALGGFAYLQWDKKRRPKLPAPAAPPPP